MPKTSSQERAERRRAARFAADYRVVCRLGHDALTTSTRDLSQGGMRLAYTGHVADTPAEFHIDLADGEPPLRVRGHAVSDGPQGLRVEFERNELARKRIRKLIRGQVIPALEETVRQTSDPDRIDELAACLREVGLVDDAIQLYRNFSPPPRTTTTDTLSEIDRLRAAIRRQRRTLYAGFERLLKDRNRLRQLTGEGALDAAPQEHRRLTALLRGVRREVEILEGGTDPEADLPGTGRPQLARALRRHQIGIAVGLMVLIAGVTIGRWSAPTAPTPAVALASRAPSSTPPSAIAPAPASEAPQTETEDTPTPRAMEIDALLDKLAAEQDEERRRARKRARTAGEAVAPPPTATSELNVTESATHESGAADPDFERALRYLRDRRIALAVVALQRVVARSPDHAEAHRLLGLGYVLIEQQNRARVALGRFLELEPDHARAEQARKVLASLQAP